MAKQCVHRGCENTDTQQIWTEGTGNFRQKTKNIYYLCDACTAALTGKYLQTRFYVAGRLRFIEECWIADNQNQEGSNQ